MTCGTLILLTQKPLHLNLRALWRPALRLLCPLSNADEPRYPSPPTGDPWPLNYTSSRWKQVCCALTTEERLRKCLVTSVPQGWGGQALNLKGFFWGGLKSKKVKCKWGGLWGSHSKGMWTKCATLQFHLGFYRLWSFSVEWSWWVLGAPFKKSQLRHFFYTLFYSS